MVMGIGVKTFSQDTSGMEYKNLKVKFDSHETTLSTSEKVIPVYTEIKYNFNKDQKVSPFIKGNLGFNYVDGGEETSEMMDMTSNDYYSMGAGVDIDDLTLEAAYTNYQIGNVEEENGLSENRVMLKLKYKY